MAPQADGGTFFKRPFGSPCSVRDPAMPNAGLIRFGFKGFTSRRGMCRRIDVDAGEGIREGG